MKNNCFCLILAYANYYPAINMYDHGTRSAFYNATSTAGILTSAPSPFLPLGGAALDQVHIAVVYLILFPISFHYISY